MTHKKWIQNIIGLVVFGQKVLFANSAISQQDFWAKLVIRRVCYWVRSDNSTKICQTERSTKMVSPRRDYTN
jgi:hypothetical protein